MTEPAESLPYASDSDDADDLDPHALKARVLDHLRAQGFAIKNDRLITPVTDDKDRLRALHLGAVAAQRARSAGTLRRHEDLMVRSLARGEAIDVSRVRPELVPVTDRRSFEGMLWRWCSLHWSIPVSSGYGRRLRFLVMDRGNGDKVMGLIGLDDPVFALAARDTWIGWDREIRRLRLANVMDAFVLGAVPPYNGLRAGKLTALLATSTEVRKAFELRYGHRTTLIKERDPNAQLIMITTTSALGRSSQYNRLTDPGGRMAYRPVGYTSGSGDFHFSGAIYDLLVKYAAATNPDGATHAHARWKTSGARNRREVIQRALQALGLDSRQLRVHGVRRQVFVAPLVANPQDCLVGGGEPEWQTEPAEILAAHWLTRWARPRSVVDDAWRDFHPDRWRLFTRVAE